MCMFIPCLYLFHICHVELRSLCRAYNIEWDSPGSLKSVAKCEMTLNLLEFLSRYSERPRSVILRYRRSVKPGGHVGPAGHNRPWAAQLLLFLLHVVHIQRFRSVATFEYWWSFSMHLNANQSFVQTPDCTFGTTNAFQSMYRSNYSMDVQNLHVPWSNWGPSSPMLGDGLYSLWLFHIVAFVADERFTIFQWWNI